MVGMVEIHDIHFQNAYICEKEQLCHLPHMSNMSRLSHLSHFLETKYIKDLFAM